jgi:surface protein
MFHNAHFNHPIGNWNVKNVRDMGEMFSSNQYFN